MPSQSAAPRAIVLWAPTAKDPTSLLYCRLSLSPLLLGLHSTPTSARCKMDAELSALRQELSAAREELRALHAQHAFEALRSLPTPALGSTHQVWEDFSPALQWQLSMQGRIPVDIIRGPNLGSKSVDISHVAEQLQARASAAAPKVDWDHPGWWRQIGGGAPVSRLLKQDNSSGRPVWSRKLLREMLKIRQNRGSLSPPDYRDAAEDLELACRTFLGGGSSPSEPLSVGVFSAISPWAELVMHGCLQPSPSAITTVDYNPPIILNDMRGDVEAAAAEQDRPDLPLRSIDARMLPLEWSRGRATFDVIVSFSGIEHDGLTRYGDPVNPYGDMAAMREMWHCLRPNGLLLLGIPLSAVDALFWPGHRLYGPVRLPLLVSNFTLLAHVRQGRVTTSRSGRTLYGSTGRWAYQPVLVLRKEAEGVPPRGLRDFNQTKRRKAVELKGARG